MEPMIQMLIKPSRIQRTRARKKVVKRKKKMKKWINIYNNLEFSDSA